MSCSRAAGGKRGLSCLEQSHAYLIDSDLWQVGTFWEDVDQPSKLRVPPKPPWARHRDQQQRIDWYAPSFALPDWVLRRVFTIECIGTFYECLLLAETFYRRKTYSFQPGYITRRRIPYWLVEKGENGEFTVHWWVSRSLSSLVSQSSSHFTSFRAKSCPGKASINSSDLVKSSE